MCVCADVDGELCVLQVDLMDALGTADIVPLDGATVRMKDCLCTIDLEATAAKHGYRLERVTDHGCAADWRMVPIEEPVNG